MFWDWENVVKMTIPSKIYKIYRFNATLLKFFHRIITQKFTICMDTQNIPNKQNNLMKKGRAGGIRFTDFRLLTKLRSSRHNSTGTKREIKSNGIESKVQR